MFSKVSVVNIKNLQSWVERHYLTLALSVALLILYALTLDRGLQPEELRGGDLITHQYAQVQARPSNAPGYPLYTMGGWLWFHSIRTLLHVVGIALPNPIPILSSYSTLWALLAVALLFSILCRITKSEQRPNGDKPVAALLTLFYGVTYFFWYYATTSEQYSSAIAQTLAIVYLYLRWRSAIGNDPEQIAGRLLVGLALLCGISLAHMLTVAFIVPPLIAVILWERPQLLKNWRIITACLVAALLPLLSYLYVYERGAAHPEWWGNGNWTNAGQWFWAFVSTSQGRQELAWGLEAGRAFFGGQFPALMWQELSLPILLCGLIGLHYVGRHLATMLYTTIVIYLGFCWLYRFGNWYQVILPLYPLILLGIAAPISAYEQRNEALLPAAKRRWIWLVLILALLWRFDASYLRADSSHRPGDQALDRAAILLTQPLPAHAALFTAVDDALALQYLIDIWQIRPDLQTVSSLQAEKVLAEGRPLLATWEALATLRSELPNRELHLSALSPDWVALQSTASKEPPFIENRIAKKVEANTTFEGFTLLTAPTGVPVTTTQPTIDVMLYWRLGSGQWPPGLSISIRPMYQGELIHTDATNGDFVQQDVAAPMKGLLTTEILPVGSLIGDPYRLLLPANRAQPIDQLKVILYRNSGQGFDQVAEIHLPIKR